MVLYLVDRRENIKNFNGMEKLQRHREVRKMCNSKLIFEKYLLSKIMLFDHDDIDIKNVNYY